MCDGTHLFHHKRERLPWWMDSGIECGVSSVPSNVLFYSIAVVVVAVLVADVEGLDTDVRAKVNMSCFCRITSRSTHLESWMYCVGVGWDIAASVLIIALHYITNQAIKKVSTRCSQKGPWSKCFRDLGFEHHSARFQ